MFTFFRNCLTQFENIKFLPNELIAHGNIKELARRFDNGSLTPDSEDADSCLLQLAIWHCTEKKYHIVCPVVCLLFERGVKFDKLKGNKAHGLIISGFFDPGYYNESLVNLALTYGAKFDDTWKNQYAKAAQAAYENRHTLFEYEKSGKELFNQGHYTEAIEALTQAREIISQFELEERRKLAEQRIDTRLSLKTHHAIIDCYANRLLDLLAMIQKSQEAISEPKSRS